MRILYIHGLNGSPDGDKPSMLRRAYPLAELIAPSHDSRPDATFSLLDGIARGMDPARDVIVGSSLGGFWANHISLRYGIPALLLNPLVCPSAGLGSLGCDYAGDYLPYEAPFVPAVMPVRSVLLASDDEVLPFGEALARFSSECTVKVISTGGHRLNDPASLDEIRKALDELIVRSSAAVGVVTAPHANQHDSNQTKGMEGDSGSNRPVGTWSQALKKSTREAIRNVEVNPITGLLHMKHIDGRYGSIGIASLLGDRLLVDCDGGGQAGPYNDMEELIMAGWAID